MDGMQYLVLRLVCHGNPTIGGEMVQLAKNGGNGALVDPSHKKSSHIAKDSAKLRFSR